MRTYTAIEAARTLGVSEKTIRRWIEENKLQARRVARNKLAIPENEIERLAQEREQAGALDQVARLEALEQKYRDLEARYSGLVERIAALEALTTNKITSAPGPARRQAEPVTLELFSTPAPSDLPAGAMLYADFARRHGVNPYTFRDHLTIGIGRGLEEKDKVEHTTRPIPNRKEVERWLSPAQQHAAILFWQRHNKAYTPCPDCPHNEQDSVTSHMSLQDGDSTAKKDPGP
jgi:excisionase family DNA binding protein